MNDFMTNFLFLFAILVIHVNGEIKVEYKKKLY
jgi:hypothetical protein